MTTQYPTPPAPSHRRRLRAMRLSLTASDPAVAAALDAARHELAGTLAAEPPAPAAATIRAALAALALGDYDAASDVIRLCAASQTPAGTVLATPPTSAPPTAPDDPTRLYLLLLARYLAWTGEIHLVRDEWPRALRALEHRPREPDHPDAGGWAATLAELAIAAESIGDQATFARLQATYPAAPEHAPPARPAPPSELAGPREDAADVVAYYIDDLLGIHPDAPRNRLVLRPWLPESWDALDLGGLRFADAEITLRYRRDGDRHRFIIDQESGAVPVRVIFEPAIPARYLDQAIVDGQEAELDPVPADGRLLVPIQLVLDTTREIVLRGGEEGVRRGGKIRLPVR